MENLFLETQEGKLPIDPKIVNKYNLEKGTKSPFTGNRIVNKYGDYTRSVPEEEPHDLSNHEDEIEDFENGMQLSTSEMLDIAQGVDNSQQ